MNKRKRDMSVEWIRIIACFLVIGAHIQLATNVDGAIRFDRQLITACIADNVPLFFLVSGYFLFAKTDQDQNPILQVYKQKLSSLFRNVLLPVTLLIIIIANIDRYIKGECELGDCTWNWETVKYYLFQFYCNQNAYDRAGHFWYICSYMKIIVWFPALALLCKKDENVTKIRRLLLFLSYLVIWKNDIQKLNGADYGSYEGMVFDQKMLYVLLGYEVYYFFHYGKWNLKQMRLYGAIIFLGGISLKLGMQYYFYHLYGAEAGGCFMGLESATCYMTAVGAFCFWHSFKDKMHSPVIGWFGKYTLYVYMFHGMVIDRTRDIQWKVLDFCNDAPNLFWDVAFYVLYGGFVFVISLGIGFVFERIYALLLLGWDKSKRLWKKSVD